MSVGEGNNSTPFEVGCCTSEWPECVADEDLMQMEVPAANKMPRFAQSVLGSSCTSRASSVGSSHW
eukprot:11535853-Karenia_brevis.AAC.1